MENGVGTESIAGINYNIFCRGLAGLVPVATGSNSPVHSKILKLIIRHIIWNTCLQCLHSTPPRGPRKSPTGGPGPWPNRRSILVFQIISCQSYTCDLRNQGKCLSKEEKFYSFQFGVGVRGKRGGNKINCRNQLQHLLPWTCRFSAGCNWI